jgi:hypothetical protein
LGGGAKRRSHVPAVELNRYCGKYFLTLLKPFIRYFFTTNGSVITFFFPLHAMPSTEHAHTFMKQVLKQAASRFFIHGIRSFFSIPTCLLQAGIHCIVPAGGLNSQHTHWIASKPHFLVPVRILSELFRARLLRLLERSFEQNMLLFNGEIRKYADTNSFKQLLISSAKTSWVVYAKEPFGGPAQVFNYLGHCTHRVGISNNRLISMTDTQVTFLWKDRRNNNRTRKMTLDALQFIIRFVLHILPKGFVKIRYYGFLANTVKKQIIPLCRNLIQDCVSDNQGESVKELPVLTIISYESLMETIYRCPVQ